MYSEVLTDRKLSMRAKPAIREVDEYITQTNDFDDWLAKACQRVMFFHKTERGKNIGFCECGKQTELIKPKGGQFATCPHCEKRVKLRHVRYADYECREFISILERAGTIGFVQRLFVCYKTVSAMPIWPCGDQEYQIKTKHVLIEEGRYYLDMKSGQIAKYHKCYGNAEWRSGRTRVHGTGWSGWRCDNMLQHTYLPYPQDIIGDTEYKYSALDIACKELLVHPILYLKDWHEHPMLEILLKIGLIGIAQDYIRYVCARDWGGCGREIYLRELKSPKDLGLHTKEDIAKCRYKGIYQVFAYQEQKKWTIPEAQRDRAEEFLVRLYECKTEGHRKMLPISLERFYTYWREQEEYQQQKQTFIGDYFDYIEICKTLGYNLDDTAIKTPKDFIQMRDNVNAIYKAKKTKLLGEAIKQVYKSLHDNVEWTDGKLSVVMPKTQDAIIREGKNQSHCVGTYCERVAKGSCVILFIRKNTAKRKAYYTMEIRPDMAKFSMVQCRGLRNADTTEDVKAFLKKYEKWFNSRPVKAA